MANVEGMGAMPSNEVSWSAGATGIQRWRSAQSWRRAVEKELRSLDLSLMSWLVLEATQAARILLQDAVSQRDVAAQADGVGRAVP